MVVTPFVVQFVMRGGEWKSGFGGGREGGEEEVYCIVWLFEKKKTITRRERRILYPQWCSSQKTNSSFCMVSIKIEWTTVSPGLAFPSTQVRLRIHT